MDDLSGKVIKGYELRDLIGVGGYGVVYSAYQPLIDREVAVKIILPEYANRPYFIRHFEIEAQLIARLEHLHIVPLYDYWREPDGAYIVMRLLRGGSLSQKLTKSGPLGIDEAATMLDQIASALNLAHRNNVIHQDLKAANILLDEEGNAYLSDFGIAKDLTRSSDEDSGDPDAVARGSPEYVSPEQILNAPISPATDIYSLGILLYEMLTGYTPFADEDDQQILRRQLYEAVPPLQNHQPELPQAFNIVIGRATEKHPKRRYENVLALARGFREFIDIETGAATRESAPTAGKTIERDEIATLDLTTEPVNPYKGLRAFQEVDAADFYGRAALIERLVGRLEEEADGARFLAVVGPSGSGKSSVVKAGLIPALREGTLPGSDNWYITEMTPGSHPIEELGEALLRVAVDGDLPLTETLREGQDGLTRALAGLLPDDGDELFLMIDQFEEIFTLVESEDDRRHFLSLLMDALHAPESRLRLIVTLRADFYDRPLLYGEFGDLMRRRTEVVLPLSPEELHQAIVQPAERVGLSLEDGLAEEIVLEVSDQPGALPLLQYALTELFMSRRGLLLTRDSYERSGGVSGALTRRADEILMMLPKQAAENARQLFLRLVTLGEGTEDTRRRALQSELNAIGGDSMTQVIERFGQYRLLAFDREPATRAPTIEIAHEALIRQWTTLREWLDANRDDLRLQRLLVASTAEWLRADRDSSFLATGARLEQFEGLQARGSLTLTGDEAAYIAASIQLRERIRRRNRALLAALAGFAIFAAVAAVIAFFNFQQAEQARADLEVAQATTVAERDRANIASDISRSRELAITALNNRDRYDLALLLSLEALHAADTFNARSTLLSLLQSNRRLQTYLHGHTDWVRAVAFSPDGTRIASGSSDTRVILWDAENRQRIGEPLEGHTNLVNSVAFSPDGDLLASAGRDNRIIIWDVSVQPPVMAHEIDDHTGDIWTVRFSPDGQMLASGSADRTVRLWNPVTGESIGEPLTGHDDTVYAIAFSPDGALLASGGEDNRVLLWDLTNDEPTASVLEGHTNWVRALAFSPDGALLASGGEDNTMRLWDGESGAAMGGPINLHTGTVRALVFDTDGARLISAGMDSAIWSLNVTTGNAEGFTHPGGAAFLSLALHDAGDLRLATGGHTPAVMLWSLNADARPGHALGRLDDPALRVTFAADGHTVLAVDQTDASTPSTVYAWNAESDEATTAVMEQAGSRLVIASAFSPDGQMLALAGADRAIILHNTTDGSQSETLTEHADTIFSLAFSIDNERMASGGNDGGIVLWERNGDGWFPLETELQAHDDRVTSLAFSPDGRWLASGSRDSAILLHDLENQSVRQLDGHNDIIESLTFDGESGLLASGGRDNAVILWDAVEGELITRLTGHSNWVNDLTFSPDGALLVSASRDHGILLWDLQTEDDAIRILGEPLAGPAAPVNAIAFSPDGQFLASAAEDGTVIRWEIGMANWVRSACAIANRALATDEGVNFLFEEEPRDACADLTEPD